jgi:AcrR family transcriptional regulator
MVFRRDGYHGTSLDRVSARAGYTKGAVSSNFKGKDDLFFAVYDRQIARRFKQLSAAMKAGGMRATVRRYLQLIGDDTEWSILLFEFTAHASRHPKLRAALAQRSEALVARLADGMRVSFAVEPEVARQMAYATLIVFNGVLFRRVSNPQAIPDSLSEALILRFLEGEEIEP